MSLTSSFRNRWDDFDIGRSHRLFDHHFGKGLCTDELWNSLTNFHHNSIFNRPYKPWSSSLARQDSGSTITCDKDNFQVILDVQQFLPSEIAVKTNGNDITIEGKHEEKQDEHGFISRHFVRRYVLPQEHDVNNIISTLSSDGILTVTAPKKSIKEVKTERIIPISQVGPSKVTVTPVVEEKF